MNKPFSLLTQFAVVTVAGISFASLLIQQPSFAEPSGNPLQNLTPQDDNPLAPRSSEVNNSAGSGIFDLIHRAQLSNSPWDANEQDQQLNDAAAAFRAKQQRLLQQSGQQPTNSRSQVITPR